MGHKTDLRCEAKTEVAEEIKERDAKRFASSAFAGGLRFRIHSALNSHQEVSNISKYVTSLPI